MTDTQHTSWPRPSLPNHYPVVVDQHSEPGTNRPADGAFLSVYYWFTRKFSRGNRSYDGRNDEKLPATIHDMPVSPSLATAGSHRDETTDTASTSRSHTSPLLKPAPDYRKMGSIGPSGTEEPLTGHLAKVKQFVHQIHELPWVANDRVTVDYYPGRSSRRLQVQPTPLRGTHPHPRPLRHGPRHVRSWYSEQSDSHPFALMHGGNGSPQPSSFTAADYSAEPMRSGDVQMNYPTGYVPAEHAPSLVAEHSFTH